LRAKARDHVAGDTPGERVTTIEDVVPDNASGSYHAKPCRRIATTVIRDDDDYCGTGCR
jgi:hypothetical protein